MNFKIGDKVVFLPPAETYFKQFDFPVTALNNDTIYIVRGFDGHGSDGIYLEGVFNEYFHGCELSYTNYLFEKVQDNFAEQVLEKILEDINKGVLI